MLIHIIKVIKSDHLLGHNGAKGFMKTHSNFYMWINLKQRVAFLGCWVGKTFLVKFLPNILNIFA